MNNQPLPAGFDARSDCLVLGGGPSGAAVAALVAGAGYSTILVDRHALPRVRGGGLPLPAAAAVLRRLRGNGLPVLGAGAELSGVQWFTAEGHLMDRYEFVGEPACAAGAAADASSQVERCLFDLARRRGASCRERTSAVDLVVEGNDVVGAAVADSAGNRERLAARVVVDAAGAQAPWRRPRAAGSAPGDEPSAVVRGCYRGIKRDPAGRAGGVMMFRARSGPAWFSFVPLSAELVVVAVAAPAAYLVAGRGKPESVFEEELTNCPAALDRMVDAELAGGLGMRRGPEFPCDPAPADGCLVVGDALCGTAPLPGWDLALALQSAELAAGCIVECLDRGGAAMCGARYAQAISPGLAAARALRAALLDRDFDPASFVAAHRECRQVMAELLAGRLLAPGLAEFARALAGCPAAGSLPRERLRPNLPEPLGEAR